MRFFSNCSLRSCYRILIKRIRKTVENQQFRPIFSGVLVVTIVLVAVFPNATAVFGQMQGSPGDLIKTDVIATGDIIMTTKQTSQFPVVGRLSQRFSYYHPGIDIEQPFNSPIHPFLSGAVFEAGSHGGGYGNYILIDHQNGYFSLYAHLNSILVKKNDPVTQETVIGTVGLTGRTTGSHLHLEIYENGRAINPLTILPEATVASVSTSIQTMQGEPAVHPTQTLVLPLSQEANSSIEQQAPATGGPIKKAEEKVQNPSLGIWLPDSLKQTAQKPAADLGGSKANHQLPTLVQF